MADYGNTETDWSPGEMKWTLRFYRSNSRAAVSPVATPPPPTPRSTPNSIQTGAPPSPPSGAIAAARALPRPPRTPSEANGPSVHSPQTAAASDQVLSAPAPDAPLPRDAGPGGRHRVSPDPSRRLHPGRRLLPAVTLSEANCSRRPRRSAQSYREPTAKSRSDLGTSDSNLKQSEFAFIYLITAISSRK
jgi:hypothetical protein